MASSIHIEAVKTSSFLHNDRTMKVSYLIDDSSKNYCSVDSTTALENFNHYKEIATKKYQEITKQKLQAKTIFLKEAIINLQSHHTEKDLEPIIKKLESYGFKVLQVSIHRDEGFLNKETNKNQYNYHAHITMFNLDLQTGKSVKFGKNYRTELSKLQTFVANTLKMERGKVSDKTHAEEINKEYDPHQTRRLGTHQYKRAMKEQEEKRIEQKQELQNTKLFAEVGFLENKYLHKDYQAKITSLVNVENSLKKELHGLNNEITRIKNDEILKGKKIEELNKKIKMYETTFRKIAPDAQSTNEVMQHIAHNESETAQKLTNAEKTINTLINQKADVVAQNLTFKEHIAVKNKAIETDGKQKKSFLAHFKAPENADFWGFLRQKVSSWLKEIRELKAENLKLKAENQALKAKDLPPARPIEECLAEVEEINRRERDILNSLAAQADEIERESSRGFRLN